LLQLDIRLTRRLLASGAVALTCGALAGQANAASPPPPESTANCYGKVSPTPTADEPNLLEYKFNCDQRITAYTILVHRGLDFDDTIDDFSPAPNVFLQDGTTPDATASWTCEGTVPSSSANCNTGAKGAFMGAWSWVDGTVDTVDPYCKNIPAPAKPGAWAEPQAWVQVVVTDVSGAQDGPFRLYYSQACPAVPDRVPFPPKPKPKPKHRAKKHTTTTAKGTK
jgi:hypothetical protein